MEFRCISNLGEITKAELKQAKCPILLFTARKRSLWRLCFHRCLSVHRWGVCHWSGGVCHTPWADTHPGQTPRPPGRHPPPADTTGYGQQVGGMHPTRMHSCLQQKWHHHNLARKTWHVHEMVFIPDKICNWYPCYVSCWNPIVHKIFATKIKLLTINHKKVHKTQFASSQFAIRILECHFYIYQNSDSRDKLGICDANI